MSFEDRKAARVHALLEDKMRPGIIAHSLARFEEKAEKWDALVAMMKDVVGNPIR